MSLESITGGWPSLWPTLEETIHEDSAFKVFSALADTTAPSQLAWITRGPVLRELLLAEGPAAELLRFEPNLWRTGTVAMVAGKPETSRVWLLGHLDTISYAIGRDQGDRYRLTPLCLHQIMEGSRPGVAVRVRCPEEGFQIAAEGEIVSHDSGRDIHFHTPVRGLPTGTRVTYKLTSTVDPETGLMEGDIDNAFSCAAIYLALVALAALSHGHSEKPPPRVMAVFPDEEEGVVSSGNQAFSRGSARLFHRAPAGSLPDLVVVSDVQEAPDKGQAAPSSLRMGDGATYAEVSSRGKGVAVPPHLFAFQHELAAFLSSRGIRLRENADGYLSRSDDVSAIAYVPNVSLIGFLGANRHLARGNPQANLRDLVDLARTLAVYSLIAQDDQWRRRYLGCADDS